MERGASRVGRDYTLIPVLVSGVFHPKCTYLAGPDGDLLLVGSGNLTFGGYGRNVEVLEILQPKAHPQAFLDFASFLEALMQRPSLETPNRTCVNSFVKYARSAAATVTEAPSGEPVRLLHSVNESIVSQLAEHCETHGGARRISVLSPYHDANGLAIKELARATRCSTLRIALPPNPAEVSSFPFSLASKLNLKVSAIRPKMDKVTGRRLHAKWIEVATPDGTVTLTGSVNATYPALCSTKNIEVGVLRHSRTPMERWERAEVPTLFEPMIETSGDDSRRGLVYARLTAGGKIIGHMLPHADVAGVWQLRLEKTGQILLDVNVGVDSSGQFGARCENPNDIFSIGTVRVLLVRDQRTVVGWLEMEELVRMTLEQRTIFGAMSRFLSKQATDDDDVALLNYLAVSSSHHLNDLFSNGKQTSSGKGLRAGDTQKDAVVPLSSIAPSTNSLPTDRARFLHHSNVDTLKHWFQQFREEVLSPSKPISNGRSSGPKGVAHPAEKDEEPEDLREHEDKSRALEGLDRNMLEQLRETPDPEMRRNLLCIWHDVAIFMLCHRLNTPEDCPVFLHSWLANVQQYAAASEAPEELEKYFFTSVAILAFYGTQEDSTHTLRQLHESLENFCGRQVTAQYANAALDRRWEQGVGRKILGVANPTFDVYLRRVLGTRTTLDEIQSLYDAIRENRPVDFTSVVFDTTNQHGYAVAGELRSRLQEGNALRFVVPRRDALLDSSCHWIRFSETERANYLARRIAKCPSCGKFNLRMHP